LFLDEVFDGIDTDNVDLILKILKDITRKYKVNIIIVHHNVMDKNHFDKILEVKKTTHSDLSDLIIKK
jgi:ABC-type Mn2+/Zn2+ transport system ATPase subunit